MSAPIDKLSTPPNVWPNVLTPEYLRATAG